MLDWLFEYYQNHCNITVETGIPPTVTKTITPIPTKISTLTETPQPTLTPTPSPTSVPSPSWTPIPTLLPDKIIATITALKTNNGGCKLPCWWGITPGKTTLKEANDKLGPLGEVSVSQIGRDLVKYEFQSVVLVNNEPTIIFVRDFLVYRDIVIAMIVPVTAVSSDFDYSLAGLLSTFAEPEEIWVSIVPESPLIPTYQMFLSYPTTGVEIFLDGAAKVEGDTFTFCPQDIGSFEAYLGQPRSRPWLFVWSWPEKITFQEMEYSVLKNIMIMREAYFFSKLDGLADGYNTERFYETYRDPKAKSCINIKLK